VLIAEPGEALRVRLRLLVEADPVLELVGACASGREALEGLGTLRPDVLLVAVEMPDVDAFTIAETVGVERMPATIFLSEGPEAAIRAFEVGALDYVRKPAEDARYRRALSRARRAHHARLAEADPRIVELLARLGRREGRGEPRTLAIRVGGQYRFVAADQIRYVDSDRSHVRLHLAGDVRYANRSLAEMEERILDPDLFVRIHRSTIVNIQEIAFVEALFHGDLAVVLKDGTRLACSRRYRGRLQERVHFTS
jgi:two-component system LytT family response regulator